MTINHHKQDPSFCYEGFIRPLLVILFLKVTLKISSSDPPSFGRWNFSSESRRLSCIIILYISTIYYQLQLSYQVHGIHSLLSALLAWFCNSLIRKDDEMMHPTYDTAYIIQLISDSVVRLGWKNWIHHLLTVKWQQLCELHPIRYRIGIKYI